MPGDTPIRHHLPAALALLAMACVRPTPRAAAGTGGPPASWAWAPQGVGRLAWFWTGGGAKTDWITRVTSARDGSLLAVGFVDRDDSAGGPSGWDAVAMRLTPEGRVLWFRRFGGAGLDALWDVKELPDGGVAAAGFSSSGGAGANDAWLVLLDADGALRRERRYGGAADDLALSLDVAPDGGLWLVGQTQSEGAGERDVLVVRTDPLGEPRWTRAYGGPGVDRGFYVAALDDGVVLSGVTGAERAYDVLTMRLASDGEVRWRDVVGGEGNDPNHGLRVLPDGGVLVVGYAQSWGSTVHDLVALTYAPDGRLLRHEVMGGPGDDRVMGVVPELDGGTLLVGYTRSHSAGGWDVLVARVRPDGAFEPWLAAVGTSHDDQAYAAARTADGGLVLGGYAQGAAGAPPDLLLARLDVGTLVRRSEAISARRIR